MRRCGTHSWDRTEKSQSAVAGANRNRFSRFARRVATCVLLLSTALGCPDVFQIPDGVGGRFSILTAVGLLPAAIMGLDIVRLLEGAAAMNEHFCTAPVGENVVLDFTAVGCDYGDGGSNIENGYPVVLIYNFSIL